MEYVEFDTVANLKEPLIAKVSFSWLFTSAYLSVSSDWIWLFYFYTSTEFKQLKCVQQCYYYWIDGSESSHN